MKSVGLDFSKYEENIGINEKNMNLVLTGMSDQPGSVNWRHSFLMHECFIIL